MMTSKEGQKIERLIDYLSAAQTPDEWRARIQPLIDNTNDCETLSNFCVCCFFLSAYSNIKNSISPEGKRDFIDMWRNLMRCILED